MQFRGYHINNLKSYRKYFCFLDAVDALENGAYGEWLAAIPETMKEREVVLSEDGRTIEEIRLLLDQCSKAGKAAEWGEESYRKLFLLFYKLAHLPVADGDMEEINRLACFEAEKQKKGQADGAERTDTGMEILLTGKEYRLPVWRRDENHQPFVWKKIVNTGSCPVFVKIVNEERINEELDNVHEEEYKKAYVTDFRCLNPGGYAWMLTQNGSFVRWGRRVQVHQRSFACVDRKGCLTVDGYPMQGDGMVDFSFDRQTGILGVDRDGGLRQYSSLELEGKAGSEGKLSFACLKGKAYVLVWENGTFVTNRTDDAGDLLDIFNRQVTEKKLCQEKVIFQEGSFHRESVAKELPFPAAVVSVSDQLIGFETPDSCVGVWDRELERMLWMEKLESAL